MMSPLETAASYRDRLIKVVDPARVTEDPKVLAAYSEDCSFVAKQSPLLVVYPKDKDEVQGIVRLANEIGMPLIPVSSGPPRFRGDTIPGKEGGVIIDFTKMKRILRIDPRNRYVMIEPGVTYGELVPELKKQGLRLCAPLLPRASKSVVTSYLEREPVLIPKYQYDYLDPLLTLEVVYGTGDHFRTGSASGPGSLETLKADKVNPFGPGAFDFFRFVSGAQGTIGLVTWAITKTEVLPSLQKLYFVPANDVQELTIAMNRLLRRRVVDECLALNHVNVAALLAEEWPKDFERIKTSLPPWTLVVCVAGYERRPDERVHIQAKYMAQICEDLGLKLGTAFPGAEGKETTFLELLSNPWHREPYWKLRGKTSCHDIFFLSPLSKVSKFIGLMKEIVSKHNYPMDEVGCYVQPLVQGRGCHCEFNLPCEKSNIGEVAEVQKLFMDASETLMNSGAFFSRPYGPWSDMVYRRDAAGVAALKSLKRLFDPNRILNPGKLCF
jgi:FAD/FMN-containing dehydrogenase